MKKNREKNPSTLPLQRFFRVFQALRFGEIHVKQDEGSGLLAIIAIHSTTLGPALGGCRFLPYPTIDLALIDALRLAQGMSYKAAICDLPFGGGKAVIVRPPALTDRVQLFQTFGQFVHELGGRYITAEDSGTGVGDMDIIRAQTPYVTGHSHQLFSCKDPSPLTAFGVRRGIEAAVKHHLKRSLEGIHVAIQGVGHVGYHLAKELYQHGAKLTVSDLNPQATERCQLEFGAMIAPPHHVHKLPCEVFAPCALGSVINHKTIHHLQAQIIAGSANNQLERPEFAKKLQQRGILYAPDYAINAGGLIYVTSQYTHQNESVAVDKINNIYNTLEMIFDIAKKEELPTSIVADRLAEERLNKNA